MRHVVDDYQTGTAAPLYSARRRIVGVAAGQRRILEDFFQGADPLLQLFHSGAGFTGLLAQSSEVGSQGLGKGIGLFVCHSPDNRA